ncbi:YqiA/YcfP family alpha/beta fold hydrolase [uncultured Paenalcaligenes sp.]|uniref:YqiA/YcfP family alpha/beta fold hydrolase n=1 Tax=uncultured Paenalcaligenes sp. TaxID=1588925 RepID=UPI002633424E|nr:YqiA/YcfP family alpha/beta fold hydrolase [uncultured Paenalcaligenes sp.]
MILYLHGFRSSPSSYKAQVLAKAVAEKGWQDQWVCPQLPESPAAAIALCNQLIQEANLTDPATDLRIIGSSLGGYYAHVLAEQWGCKALLLNPAVHAPRDLATQVGEHRYYHSDVPFVFHANYIDELTAMQPSVTTQPQRYYLIAASGDEVLNYQEMLHTFSGSQGFLIFGSDHGISDFDLYLSPVLHFIAPSIGS